ncbi:GNAT family N-acetyltransferase [Reinekea marina]|uniref:GNAT family N-acetyltransferase n=1 Tax=Reinekea marina TaxID=1310421 RepID=A0ABV7WU57_9GAMM|nr:GNAT family N-acetyltransferase [Reinekea marina]MDN3650033.1 GNAT family N-acetyltransferase [Reinekea marina]
MEIKSVKTNSQLAEKLFSLLKSEWPEFEGFKQEKLGVKIPDPIVSSINGELVGGLSFTSYQVPMSDSIAIWINAVFVIPKFRGMGIASKMIDKTQEVAEELYALTDVPELYSKLDWNIVLKNENGTTVKNT